MISTKWRAFSSLLGPAAFWRSAARARQGDWRKRIGWLDAASDDSQTRARLTAFREKLQTLGWFDGASDDSETRTRLSAIRKRLEALGWFDGRNVEITARFGAADPSRNQIYVADLLNSAPDVILATDATSISALMKETRTIPIVCPIMTDLAALDFTESLARPSGNVTGFIHFEPTTATKWVELLREIAPSVNRIAILVDPGNSIGDRCVNAAEVAAVSLGVPSTKPRARDGAELEQVISAFAQEPDGGMILPPAALQAFPRDLIVKLAARHRLPAVYPRREMVLDGGLMSYGPDVLDMYRRAATYVDRILKGEKPADLPIHASTKFELVINLKTAKGLGLELPPALLNRADEVIE
jgi:putative ABC transport system substrate-binding protein